jgi:hypothetical protein
VSDTSLRSLRDLMKDRPQGLTFADLPGTVLEDLALGWSGGRPTARIAAELASRVDGIPLEGRDQEIAGRALLTLLVRRGAPVEVRAPADHVRFLGNPAADEEGDPEARDAWQRREDEYASLDALPAEYAVEEYAADLKGAFAAARAEPATAPPPDAVAASHRLALLCTGLPAGLRAWFHERYGADRADALAWKFVLVGRALAHHRNGMLETGVLSLSAEDAIPERLVRALLALDLGQLARTAILEPL